MTRKPKGPSETDQKRLASGFERLAQELNEARRQETRSVHLMIRAHRAIVQAARLTVEAVNAGVLPDSDSLRANLHYLLPGKIEGKNGKLEIASNGTWNIQLFAEPIPTDGPIPTGELSDDVLHRIWVMPISPLLHSRYPSAFKPKPGVFDWVAYRKGSEGRLVDRSGNPLHFVKTEHIDHESGAKSVSYRLNAEPVEITDGYNEADWLAHSRNRIGDWADACRLLSRLITTPTQKFQAVKRIARWLWEHIIVAVIVTVLGAVLLALLGL